MPPLKPNPAQFDDTDLLLELMQLSRRPEFAAEPPSPSAGEEFLRGLTLRGQPTSLPANLGRLLPAAAIFGLGSLLPGGPITGGALAAGLPALIEELPEETRVGGRVLPEALLGGAFGATPGLLGLLRRGVGAGAATVAEGAPGAAGAATRGRLALPPGPSGPPAIEGVPRLALPPAPPGAISRIFEAGEAGIAEEALPGRLGVPPISVLPPAPPTGGAHIMERVSPEVIERIPGRLRVTERVMGKIGAVRDPSRIRDELHPETLLKRPEPVVNEVINTTGGAPISRVIIRKSEFRPLLPRPAGAPPVEPPPIGPGVDEILESMPFPPSEGDHRKLSGLLSLILPRRWAWGQEFGVRVTDPIFFATQRRDQALAPFFTRINREIIRPLGKNSTPESLENVTHLLENNVDATGRLIGDVSKFAKHEVDAALSMRKLYNDAVTQGVVSIDSAEFLNFYAPRRRRFIETALRGGEDLKKAEESWRATMNRIIPEPKHRAFYHNLERTGAMTNYDKNALGVLQAYLRGGSFVKFVEPVMDEVNPAALRLLRVGTQFVDDAGFRLYQKYLQRVAGFPTADEAYMSNSIRNMARAVGMKELADSARPALEFSGMLTNLVYSGALGFRLGSALKNLTQLNLAWSDLGMKYTLRGISDFMKTPWPEFEKLAVLSPGLEGLAAASDAITRAGAQVSRMSDYSLKLFNAMERFLRGSSYYGARAKFLELHQGGADLAKIGVRRALRPEIEALLGSKGVEAAADRFGRDVVGNTQFLYGPANTAALLSGPLGRMLGTFTSWPINYGSLLAAWAKEGRWDAIARHIMSAAILSNVVADVADIDISNWFLAGAIPTDFLTPAMLGAPYNLARAGIFEAQYRFGAMTVEDSPVLERLRGKAYTEFLQDAPILIPGGLAIRDLYRFSDEGDVMRLFGLRRPQ